MTRRIVLAHGGAEADAATADGPERAAQAAARLLATGASALDAVVEAVRILEADGRFNAGRGSHLRLDGETVQMDAAVAEGTGRFGAVIGIERVEHPILVARDVLDTPHVALAGEGALRFARGRGHGAFDPRTPKGRRRALGVAPTPALLRDWNYPTPPARAAHTAAPDADTVGAVAFDGRAFAAASSTGGLTAVLRGRVSDVALPGCGIDAGPAGAVCVTGAGDDIARARVASRLLRRLEGGATPEEAAAEALTWTPPGLPLAVIVLGAEGEAARGRGDFPWSLARAG